MNILANGDNLNWYAPGTEPKVTQELLNKLTKQVKMLVKNYNSWKNSLIRKVY